MTLPLSGWIKLESKLNKVVLPAPLGPINPVILPLITSIFASSTALIPPKFLQSPVAANSGNSGDLILFTMMIFFSTSFLGFLLVFNYCYGIKIVEVHQISSL